MKILILDDHPLFANALSQIALRLESQVHIDMSTNTREAFEFIEMGNNYDLILVDLKLQGLDGFGFMRALNDKFISSPIIVISSNDKASDVQYAYELGAMAFIHKSTQSNEMLQTIRQVLNGQIYHPENDDFTGGEPLNSAYKNPNDAVSFGISERQYSVLCLINSGLSNKEIARKLEISESTVKTHVSRLIASLAVHNRTACVTEALRLGLL